MASTRGQIERDVALLLGEDPSSPGFGEPMWLRRCVVNATDHVARVSDCYQSYFTLDIAGSATPQAVFCGPRELYRLDRVIVTLSDATKVVLTMDDGQVVTPAAADRIVPYWQTNPDSGPTPFLAIVRLPDVILYPFPDWDQAAGAEFHGWAVPGDWAGAGVEAPTDPFPLPEYARQAVVYQAALTRCVQFPSKENQLRMPFLKDSAEDQIGLMARDAALLHGRSS